MAEIVTNWGTMSHLKKRVLEMTYKEFQHVFVALEKGLRKWTIDVDWMLLGILMYLKNSYLDCKRNRMRLNLALGKKQKSLTLAQIKGLTIFGVCTMFTLFVCIQKGLFISWFPVITELSCLILIFCDIAFNGETHWQLRECQASFHPLRILSLSLFFSFLSYTILHYLVPDFHSDCLSLSFFFHFFHCPCRTRLFSFHFHGPHTFPIFQHTYSW